MSSNQEDLRGADELGSLCRRHEEKVLMPLDGEYIHAKVPYREGEGTLSLA